MSDPIELTESDDAYDVTELTEDSARFRLYIEFEVAFEAANATRTPGISTIELDELDA